MRRVNSHEERLTRLEKLVAALQRENAAIKAAAAKMIDAVQVKVGLASIRPPTCRTCGSADVEVRHFAKPSLTKRWLVCRVCAHSRTIDTPKVQ
ncbi:MAG: hypothetical protein ABI868_07125 [Acidobacteriota bacterium]